MKYTLVIVLILATFIAVSTKYAEAAAVETAPTEIPEAVEVGNTICPVSGDEIDTEAKVTYEYEGKIYNFCCPECVDEFKEDPEGYIAILEEESEE